MTRQTIYPTASRSQDFSSRYVGSLMTPNVVVLHSTEGPSWPSYSSGAVAPHFTILPDFATKTVKVRQHFPVNRSARALVNAAGGVETNTLNAVQIEMVGTCDLATSKKWGSTPHVYMPEAPDWYLEGVAHVLRWLADEWNSFPLVDAAPRGWPAYPGSYANGKGQRMTGTEWQNAYGVVGHQHVPENAHGDPGAFPIARTLAFAKGVTTAPPTPVVAPADVDVLDPANYPPNGYLVGPHIQWLGERLVAHGFSAAYTYGPTPEWGAADLVNVREFQAAQGWTGADADGYPGAETLRLLAAAPVPPSTPKTVTVTSEFLNTAGYNGVTAPGVTRWKKNVDGIAPRVVARKPDVLNVAELSNRAVNRMRPRLDAALSGYKRAAGGSDGRYVYRRTSTTDLVASGVFVTPNTTKYRLKKDDKQAAWLVYRHEGALALDVACHTENESGADTIRVSQALYFLDQALAVAKKYGVPVENVALFGDFNSESYVATAFAEHGWKVAASAYFVGWDGKSRKRFDLALVRDGVVASGKEVSSRGYSDHNGLTLTRELVLT